MYNQNKLNQYKNNSILTASKQDLTLMLYNGAITFCNKAKKAIEEKDIQTAHNNIVKTQNIIEEFIITLDKKYPIAEEYEKMYVYMLEKLVEANSSKDVKILDEVIYFLKEFRDTWKEVMKKAKTTA